MYCNIYGIILDNKDLQNIDNLLSNFLAMLIAAPHIGTDGDVGEDKTIPFLKEIDFETLSSEFLEIKKLYPLLLASILLVFYLPISYADYHIKKWLNVANKLYNKQTGNFIDDEKITNNVLKNNNFVKSLCKNDNK